MFHFHFDLGFCILFSTDGAENMAKKDKEIALLRLEVAEPTKRQSTVADEIIICGKHAHVKMKMIMKNER